MGQFKWVQTGMPLAGCFAGQVDVGVGMLAFGEVVVHGRTEKRQKHRSDKGDREAPPNEVGQTSVSDGKTHGYDSILEPKGSKQCCSRLRPLRLGVQNLVPSPDQQTPSEAGVVAAVEDVPIGLGVDDVWVGG